MNEYESGSKRHVSGLNKNIPTYCLATIRDFLVDENWFLTTYTDSSPRDKNCKWLLTFGGGQKRHHTPQW